MMNKLRNFLCQTGDTFERLVDDKTTQVKCLCGRPAIKTLSAPRYFSNSTGKSPAR